MFVHDTPLDVVHLRTLAVRDQSFGARMQNSLPSGSASTTQDSLALADVDVPGAHADHPVDLGLLVVGP